MAGIAFEHVTKVFADGTAAVADVSLRVHDGEFCVLVGPSGCGKSTALRLVAGLELPTHGNIFIGDRDMNGVPPRERGLGMVFHGAALFPHLDVEHNLRLAHQLGGEPAGQRSERVRRASERTGIGALLGRRPRTLSEGQRQQAALGRAMVRRPQALLMDEPLSNLDAKTRGGMRAAIRRQHRELGTTVLYVTHDQAEAMALADRVAVMHAGRLEQVDAPRALYEHPATLFVAAFIGSPPMNLWHVRVAEDDGQVVLVCAGRRVPVPADLLARRPGLTARVGHHLVLGIRPERLTTTGEGAPLLLPVVQVETLGSHQLVHLEAEGAGLDLASHDAEPRALRDDEGASRTLFTRAAGTLVARVGADADVRPGERLRVRLDLEQAHFFDLDTQAAVP